MNKLRWQLIIIFLTGLVVGILLLGEQPTAVKNLTPEPARGGIYTEALVGSPQRLNPILDFQNPVDRDVDKLLFSGLVKFDSGGLPQPDLAEKWGISKDGTVYNFSIRPDAYWHDGEPVTADDVAFTIDMIRTGKGVIRDDLRSFWEDVEINVLSDKVIQFRLPEPYAPFLDYLTFGVLPQHLLAGMNMDQMIKAPFNLQPVGSGPYRFKNLIVDKGKITGLELVPNDKYFGKKPYLEQVIFDYFPDSRSALQAYQDGEVLGIGNVSSDILPEVMAEPGLATYTGREPQLSLMFLNQKDPSLPFFADPVVRKALLIGLNRQWIIDHLLNSQAFLADGPILPGTWAYYNTGDQPTYNPEAARNMLKEAGYVQSGEGSTVRKKDNVPLSFTLSYPDNPLYKSIAQAIQRDWSALNIEVNLEAVPYDQLVNQRLVDRNYQAALVDLNLAQTPDPDPYPFWDQAQATGGQNYSQWDNRQASEYLEQARITTDLNERARLYRNFQVIFNQEVPAIPLFYPVYNYAVDRKVQGVQMGPLFDTSDRFATITNWHMLGGTTGKKIQVTETPVAK